MADEVRRTVPALSSDQRRAAREVASASRRRRAEVKERLRAGELTVADVLALADRDDVVAHMRVDDLLRCLPRVGQVRAAQLMERWGIAPNRRLRGLGARQRETMCQEVATWR